MRSNTGDEWWGLAHSWCSSLSQRCRVGLRSDLCAGRSSSATPNWENCCFMDSSLWGNPNHEEQPQTKRVSVVYFYYTDLCINSARLFSPYIRLLNIECKLTMCTLSIIKTSSTGKCCSLPFSVLTGSPCDPFSPGLPGKPCMWSKGKWINRQNE